MNKQQTTLMTEGNIWKKLISFAIPLFFGNLFQQLYNTADSLIVGKFLGEDALAAISSSGSLIFLIVGLFSGISMGAGVVIALYYGAKDNKKLHLAVHTTIALGLIAGVILTIVGVIFAPKILVLMDTPKEVLPSSIAYFRTYFLGSISFVLYNIFMGILQSSGDSKRPLYYLIISSCINVILDILFVGVFHYGVASAAIATVISQCISAFLCLIRLTTTTEPYRVNIREIRVHKALVRQILINGLPAGIQNSIISFANVIIQSNINQFGKLAMAGCGAYSKIEGFGFLPVTCFSLALTTFISQNLGAKEYERAKKGAKFGVLCSIILAECIGFSIYFSSPFLVSLFNDNASVIHFGVIEAHTITPFYFLLAFSHCISGILRGAGKSTVPMFVMFFSWCIVRISYVFIIIQFFHNIEAIFWAYPFTWAVSSIILFLYFLKMDWKSCHGVS